ncbi:MAG: 50S ribosomal protein L24 [Dehalococcoidia bacterium]|nr:50S ribosomal protein L24 [Dehalococcoidia bacterium]
MKVRKGDTVMVIAGKEKGKTGRVDRVLSPQDRVTIEGVNMVVRHMKPQPGVRQAGRIQKEAPIHISNVMLVCNKCDKTTRATFNVLDDGRKVRVCLRCRETID